jgi:hypothetical protein
LVAVTGRSDVAPATFELALAGAFIARSDRADQAARSCRIADRQYACRRVRGDAGPGSRRHRREGLTPIAVRRR